MAYDKRSLSPLWLPLKVYVKDHPSPRARWLAKKITSALHQMERKLLLPLSQETFYTILAYVIMTLLEHLH